MTDIGGVQGQPSVGGGVFSRHHHVHFHFTDATKMLNVMRAVWKETGEWKVPEGHEAPELKKPE